MYGSEQVTLEARSLLIIPFHELILFNIFEIEKFFFFTQYCSF